MIFFVHWSSSDVQYFKMESAEMYCDECGSNQKHTYRMYEKKNKSYSVVTTSTDRSVTITCHGCLSESSIPKEQEKQLVERYQKEILVNQAIELYQQGEYSKGLKKSKKAFKKDKNYVPAMMVSSQCLIALNKHNDAKKYVVELIKMYPDDEQVNHMREQIAQACGF